MGQFLSLTSNILMTIDFRWLVLVLHFTIKLYFKYTPTYIEVKIKKYILFIFSGVILSFSKKVFTYFNQHNNFVTTYGVL